MPEENPAEGYRWAPADLDELEQSAIGSAPSSKTINDDTIRQFRANNGTIVTGLFAGMRGLLLHTIGAKSGAPRVTPLYRFDFEGRWHVVGADGGSLKDPAWVHNLRAMTQARVEVGSDTGTTVHDVWVRELSGPQRNRVWAALRQEIPHIERFQANTVRVIPLFELAAHGRGDTSSAE